MFYEIKKITMQDLIATGYDLFVANSKEVEAELGEPVNPDYDGYKRLEKAKALFVMGAYYDSILVGYSIFGILPMPHYRHVKAAQNFVIYIDKEHRGLIAKDLIKECEKTAKDYGAKRINWHVKFKKDWSTVLLRKGYEKEEMILTKKV